MYVEVWWVHEEVNVWCDPCGYYFVFMMAMARI